LISYNTAFGPKSLISCKTNVTKHPKTDTYFNAKTR